MICLCALKHSPVSSSPQSETHADTSRNFQISAAREDAAQHWHMKPQMDFTLLFYKDFGYNLSYTREQSIPTCFRVLIDVIPYGMSACF